MMKLGGLALICVISLIVVRQWRPEWASLVRIAGAVVAFTLILSMVASVITYIRDLGGESLGDETWGLLLRALGISFICEVTAGICRDSGESEIATWVEMAGKLEILIMALPLIKAVLETARSLWGG